MELVAVDNAQVSAPRASSYSFALFLTNRYFIAPSRSATLPAHTSASNALDSLENLYSDVAHDVAQVCHRLNLIDQSMCPAGGNSRYAPEKPLLLPAVIGVLVQQCIWQHTGVCISSTVFSRWFCLAFDKPPSALLAKYWIRASHYVHRHLVHHALARGSGHRRADTIATLFQHEQEPASSSNCASFYDRCVFILTVQAKLADGSPNASFLRRSWSSCFASLTRDCFPVALVQAMDECDLFRRAVTRALVYIKEYCASAERMYAPSRATKARSPSVPAVDLEDHRARVEVVCSLTASEVTAAGLFLAIRSGCADYVARRLGKPDDSLVASRVSGAPVSALMHRLAHDIALALRYVSMTECRLSSCIDVVSDIVLGPLPREPRREPAVANALSAGVAYLQSCQPARATVIRPAVNLQRMVCDPAEHSHRDCDGSAALSSQGEVVVRLSDCAPSVSCDVEACSRFMALTAPTAHAVLQAANATQARSIGDNDAVPHARASAPLYSRRVEGVEGHDSDGVVTLANDPVEDARIESVYIIDDAERQKKRIIFDDVCAQTQRP